MKLEVRIWYAEYAAAKIHGLTTNCFEDWQRELWLWPLQRFLLDRGYRAQLGEQKDFINPVGPLPSFTTCCLNKKKKEEHNKDE